MTNTGYEGSKDHPETAVFELSHYPHQYSASGITGMVSRNGEPVGMLRLASLEELEWLKARLNGTYDPELPSE